MTAAMARFVDVHTHIQQHDSGDLPGMLARAREAGVTAIVVAGVTAADSARCVELARRHDELFAGVGYHPADLPGPLPDADLQLLAELAKRPEVVTMSEVGIDHQRRVLEKPAPDGGDWRSIQDEAFRAQIAVAVRAGLAIMFHVREPGDDPAASSAWPVALRALKEAGAGTAGGAAHYFQGNWETARRVLDAGFYISLAKPLLRLPHLQEVAAKAPIDRLVLETDSYPQPFKKNRDKWTEPRDIPLVARKLAEIRGMTVEEVADVTVANTLRMLGERGRTMAERFYSEPRP